MKRNPLCFEKPSERLLEFGVSQLAMAELLSLIINSGNRGRNAYQLAQDVLDKIEQVGNPDLDDLISVPGLGRQKSMSILAALELGRRRFPRKVHQRGFNSSQQVFNFIKHRFVGLSRERFYAIYLDSQNRPLSWTLVAEGSHSEVRFRLKDVFRNLNISKAVSFICVHNHPQGEAYPSKEDIDLTAKLKHAGNVLGVALLDHLIIAKDAQTYYSFADQRAQS